MAERRMFAKTIIDSDAFLDMPVAAQLLYFHMAMRADDDGFVNKPRAIMRLVGAKDDDAKILVSKKFIIPFDNGVVVIKHWRMHNLIRKDRYIPTKYQEEKDSLFLDENNAYTTTKPDDNHVATNGLPDGNQTATQDSIGKYRLVQGSVGEDSTGETTLLNQSICNNAREEKSEAERLEEVIDWLKGGKRT